MKNCSVSNNLAINCKIKTKLKSIQRLREIFIHTHVLKPSGFSESLRNREKSQKKENFEGNKGDKIKERQREKYHGIANTLTERPGGPIGPGGPMGPGRP